MTETLFITTLWLIAVSETSYTLEIKPYSEGRGLMNRLRGQLGETKLLG